MPPTGPPEERVPLADRLLVSVDPSPEPGADEAWAVEIATRIGRLDLGEAQPLPANEVFERLRMVAPSQ